MPGGHRRLLFRSNGSSSVIQRPGRSETAIHGINQDSKDNQTAAPIPKHAPIPDIPLDGNLVFEGMLFMYAVVAMGLQYVNLYKTVWWLPNSHLQYAVNFYLIDPNLIGFLIIIISRRLLWCFCEECYGWKSKHKGCVFWLVQVIKVNILLVVGALFLWFTVNVIVNYLFVHTLSLCYPLVVYFFLFGPSIKPLLSKLINWSGEKNESLIEKPPETKGTDKNEGSPKDLIVHNCSVSPEEIRDEVEIFKTDFNNRVKKVLFNSLVVAYYMAFIPVCFAQNSLYYDVFWVVQFVCLVWASSFIMFTIHLLPPKYIDTLHQSALHLGKWQKVEGRHAHVPYNAWSELQVWQQGTVVKHVRGLFKAEGVNNTAEPGNGMHARFHFMFYEPLRIVTLLLDVTVAIVVYQFITLIQRTEWCHVLSLAMLLFANYYSLFKLLRDRLILCRAYKEEKNMMNQNKE